MVPLDPCGASRPEAPGGVELVPFGFPGLAGVSCVFTTRLGGASLPPFDSANLSFDVGDEPARVAANRAALAAQLGLTSWCELRQVHGEALHLEPAGVDTQAFCAGPALLEGDALATQARGVALVIKTADCQPVLLAHRDGRFVAALHVGWRGNVLDLPGSAVARLCARYGCAPAELYAVRGPSLGPGRAQFLNFAAEFGPGFAGYHDPATQTVDLWRLTRDQLVAAGLDPARIFGIDRCTLAEPERSFSFRASRTTGRMMSVIWLR